MRHRIKSGKIGSYTLQQETTVAKIATVVNMRY